MLIAWQTYTYNRQQMYIISILVPTGVSPNKRFLKRKCPGKTENALTVNQLIR